MGKVSLVLPVYNEQVVLEMVLKKYIEDLENIRTKMHLEWEIIAVDDGSADESKLILINFAKKYRNFKVVSLTDRFGKHAAVAAGFSVATGSIVITAEIDIQNPLGLLENLVKEHLESKVPIIYGYQEFVGWRKKRAFFTDRMTRFASKMFMLDGYFTGIVNAELYAADVADVLRQNPTKNKYMRTMNNWVGWPSKELWYAREYTDTEAKIKMEQLRNRNRKYRPYQRVGHENSGSKWYALLCLLLAAVTFGIAISTVSWAIPLYIGILFTLAFGFLALAFLFLLRSLLLKRVGKLNYRPGEIIYKIKSILNK